RHAMLMKGEGKGMLDNQLPRRGPSHSGPRSAAGASPQCSDVDHLMDTSLRSTLDLIVRELGEIRAVLAGARKPFLTVEEFAEVTGRSAYTVRRWITENRIEARRISGAGPRGRLLIPREEIDKLILEGKGSTIPAAQTRSR